MNNSIYEQFHNHLDTLKEVVVSLNDIYNVVNQTIISITRLSTFRSDVMEEFSSLKGMVVYLAAGVVILFATSSERTSRIRLPLLCFTIFIAVLERIKNLPIEYTRIIYSLSCAVVLIW
jgi:hypothetical protein